MNLNQITISVSNVENSITFYKKLGLTLIVESLPDYARFVCPDGNATFSLHKMEPYVASQNTWIYFEVEDVDKKIIELSGSGIKIAENSEEKPWLWCEARILDPDQNIIIIYRAGINRINPPWRIKDTF